MLLFASLDLPDSDSEYLHVAPYTDEDLYHAQRGHAFTLLTAFSLAPINGGSSTIQVYVDGAAVSHDPLVLDADDTFQVVPIPFSLSPGQALSILATQDADWSTTTGYAPVIAALTP